MSLFGNLIWLLFGGIIIAIEYVIASILLMITIIGIPFGTINRPGSSGCISTLMNIIWIFVGGIWISLTHLLFGILLSITIIGLPFGMQHFKLAGLALTPFGKEIVNSR